MRVPRRGKSLAQERLERELGHPLLEPLRSWPRDRHSGIRVHPAQRDVNELMRFVFHRRKSQHAEALPAAWDASHTVNTDAIRTLVRVAQQGAMPLSMHRRCDRLLEMCDTTDKALLVGFYIRRLQQHADTEEAMRLATEDVRMHKQELLRSYPPWTGDNKDDVHQPH